MLRWTLYALVLVAPFAAVSAYQRLSPDPAAAIAGPSARPFDDAAWAHGDPTLRYEMASDLLATHDFGGWTRDDAEALLGRTVDRADGFAAPAGEEYGGSLSGDSGEASRTFWITFRTDADGRVTDAAFECSDAC